MTKIKTSVWILFICAAILFLCFAGTVSAKTLYVPDDYSAIQAAIDAASAGDTIIVRDGIYLRSGVNHCIVSNNNVSHKGRGHPPL